MQTEFNFEPEEEPALDTANATSEAAKPRRGESAVAVPPYAMPVQELPSLLVRASAGTGKTYRLTGRLINLLMQGAPIESVLATTFTRKAAGEILERVLTTLARAATDESEQALDDLQAQIGSSDVSRLQCTRLLHAIIRYIHRLRIGTLDSLFSQLARSFPFELGLPPGWRLTDENEERWLRGRAIEALLAGSELSEVTSLLSMLTKGEIKRSIAREIDSVVLSAYAVARSCSVDAWETLRPPAAPSDAELTRAAGYLLTAKIGHKSADGNLAKLGASIECREPTQLAGKELLANVKRWADKGQVASYYRKELSDDIVTALLTAYEYVRSDTLGLLAEQSKATGQILQNYDRYITALKQTTRAIAFDDVSVRLANWIDGEPLESIAYRLDGAIEHVLLDEFQDTSPQQWRVLRPLAHRAAVGADAATTDGSPVASRVPSSFFCVGDTKQAIYSWRGGVAAIFDSVDQQIPGVDKDEMSVSYRSSPVITDAVNQVFQNLTRHPLCDHAGHVNDDPSAQAPYEADAVVDFVNKFPPHAANKTDLPGYVCLQTGPECEGKADENTIVQHTYVADQVAELASRMPGRSIGILTRKNATVARLIYLLRSRGVEVSQEGGNPLIDSGAVELMLSALMLTEHPGDGRWWYHVLHSPLVQHPVLAGIEVDPTDKASLGATGLEAASRLRRFFEQRGLVAGIRELAAPLAAVCDASDSLRLRQLLQLAQQFERNPQPRLSDFVDQVREQRVERPQPAQVRVMTVHQAKGLEFDAVVLPELEYALGPSGVRCVARRPSPTDPPDGMLRYLNKASWSFLPESWQRAFGKMAAGAVTETLCLLYVSITRPRNALYMFVHPSSSRGAKSQKNAKMLLYNALDCDADPAAPETTWFESGDPQWYEPLPVPPNKPAAPPTKKIQLQPVPPVPRRNGMVVVRSANTT
ncbi:UvrD-helicase domain-containing protein [Roseimaritima ulvae]|uniref:DNA 3'-5' helicase n=1 Tax=Roseimaritima ulvae TaxID=980254 RepID=A0A5B9QQZ7_9BACT|nr:UvrD-helicase domain-containing protein [Roseimaritima ulvae]QEG41448.1 ATP-dependent helicase/nuclease subunit A [Roseimaritima ulvae]